MKSTAFILTTSLIPLLSVASERSREETKIHGWNVRIDSQLLPGGELHKPLGERALLRLASDLGRISLLLPEEPLQKLRAVTIVLDEHPKLNGAQYHPSKQWLIDNGHEASLAKCVHISKASFYVKRDHLLVQPSMLLHELAHAYHDQVLGFEYEPIKKLFARAQLKGNYESVRFVTGKERRHYALTNHKEYFAENTEAFFGTNDFYPFVRSELEQHDPDLYKLLQKIWGDSL